MITLPTINHRKLRFWNIPCGVYNMVKCTVKQTTRIELECKSSINMSDCVSVVYFLQVKPICQNSIVPYILYAFICTALHQINYIM